MIICEGLKEGDLAKLVLPLVSIDEYESKLDDTAVVLAFFVKDQDPALDLNRFIQKSSVDLLDTDISPAPNEDGYFLVFVEFSRKKETAELIVELCGLLENLTNITEWQFKAHKVKGIKDLNQENLLKFILLKPQKIKKVDNE